MTHHSGQNMLCVLKSGTLHGRASPICHALMAETMRWLYSAIGTGPWVLLCLAGNPKIKEVLQNIVHRLESNITWDVLNRSLLSHPKTHIVGLVRAPVT